MKQYKAVLTEKKQLVNNVFLFTFKIPEGQQLDFMPGQYAMLRVPKGPGFLSRMYSIASNPNVKTSFELIVEIVPGGLGSTYLSNLAIGTEAEFMAPGGVFVVKNPEKKKIFLVTGTGIAPVRSMLMSGMNNYQIYWGMKTFENVYLLDELRQFGPKVCLSRVENLDMIPEVDRQYFALGHVDDCFEKDSGGLTKDKFIDLEFYLCGGRHVVESLHTKLLEKGIPRENIHFEKF